MMTNAHFQYIRKANELARESAAAGFGPFGALLVYKGEVVATSGDRCVPESDPTAHAELAVIRKYCKQHQLISLEEYTLYTSTEPCLMCSGAIHWAKIERVVFSVSQAMLQERSGGHRKPGCATYLNVGGKKTEIIGPILPEEGWSVYEAFPFRSKKEQHTLFHSK